MKKNHPQPTPQNTEALYAKVNKPRTRGGPRTPSPEGIQANARSHSPSDYDTPPPQQHADSTYAPQNPLQETAYAPQRPIGNPYDRPGGTPSNGRRAKKLADPYAVVDLATGETEFEQRINPLYDSPSGSSQDLRPSQQPEHLYAELDFGPNGRSPHKPVESVYATVGMGAEGGRDPQRPEEHLYAELDFSENGRSPQKPVESVYATAGSGMSVEGGGAEGGRDPQKPLEDLYAKVNKPHRRGGPRIPSPEEIQANARSQSPSDYDTPRQQQAESIYPPQNPLQETAYAPQKPIGNPYDRPGGTPSNGRRAKKLASPYEVVNLSTGETEFQHRENPLYDSPSGSSQDLRPSQQPEHTYAEPDFGPNGRSPQKPLESVYATVGIGAEGGRDSQQMENPLYEGVSRATTPPPRSPKDVVTTRLLKDEGFQGSVTEVQAWCKTVYGNEHALNKSLAKILDDPKNAENILWDLAEHPESAGKLAGRQMLGIKSPDRKAAEEGFSPLCSALERHIDKTKKLHKQFTREQQRDQRHESPERDPEYRYRRRHHHHHHHARERSPDSPERSPQRQRHEENKGMAFTM